MLHRLTVDLVTRWRYFNRDYGCGAVMDADDVYTVSEIGL